MPLGGDAVQALLAAESQVERTAEDAGQVARVVDEGPHLPGGVARAVAEVVEVAGHVRQLAAEVLEPGQRVVERVGQLVDVAAPVAHGGQVGGEITESVEGAAHRGVELVEPGSEPTAERGHGGADRLGDVAEDAADRHCGDLER